MQKLILRQDDLSFRTREAYKILRSNIEFSGRGVRVITITSCTPNEGKSEVSFELGLSFAENNRRVLLIDADLRKSVMREHLLKGRVRYGLSNYLVGQCPIEECICETDRKNFDMILAGPVTPSPSELLGSETFDQLLQEARSRYDYVIIDSPPLGSVIDAAIVGQKSDGIALVLASGAISYRFAQRIVDQLVKAHCRILGCVLNKVDVDNRKGYYGKYYGRYYGSYYGSGDYYGQSGVQNTGSGKRNVRR